MQNIVFFHHTNYGLTEKIDGVESLAALEHINSFNSEIRNIEFMSFMNFKGNKILFQNNYAPWVINKYISFLIRFFYIIKLCFKYDKIIIYHSLGFIPFFPILFFFKKKIIIQMNEVYSEVSNSNNFKSIERVYLRSFNKYILSNNMLNRFTKKNSDIYVRGGYFNINDELFQLKKNQKNFIYAGLVDKVKMDNLSIILKLIKSMPDDIYLYLCVITDNESYKILKKHQKDKSNVLIYRSLPKNELTELYKLCKFGLVVQNPNKPVTNSGFPSKIFSYLNNNIIPICVSDGVLNNSEVSDLIYFIEDYNWKNIINAKNIDLHLKAHSKEISDRFKKHIFN